MELAHLTLEVRWFESGTLPIEVKHWFSCDCPGKPLEFPEEREDLYLYTPECDTFSLKLRQENLELKLRQAELGIRRFCEEKEAAQRAVCWKGKLEKWFKCTCDCSEPISLTSTEVGQEELWVIVQKVRWQRLYQGICCELTQLKINDRPSWSIACEMAGDEDRSTSHFEEVVSWISKNYQGPPLSASKSYAYPSWLLWQLT
jgi:hypothetical protein